MTYLQVLAEDADGAAETRARRDLGKLVRDEAPGASRVEVVRSADVVAEVIGRAAESDLLILGLSSPVPSERQLFALSNAGVPVLGLSVSPTPLDGIEVIAKPFDVGEIRAKVAELIQATPREPASGLPSLDSPIDLEKTVADFERQLIVQALEKCGGIQTRAAEWLGTTRRILRYRMDKLGLAPPARKQS